MSGYGKRYTVEARIRQMMADAFMAKYDDAEAAMLLDRAGYRVERGYQVGKRYPLSLMKAWRAVLRRPAHREHYNLPRLP
jgi:hypothetical protein